MNRLHKTGKFPTAYENACIRRHKNILLPLQDEAGEEEGGLYRPPGKTGVRAAALYAARVKSLGVVLLACVALAVLDIAARSGALARRSRGSGPIFNPRLISAL